MTFNAFAERHERSEDRYTPVRHGDTTQPPFVRPRPLWAPENAIPVDG